VCLAIYKPNGVEIAQRYLRHGFHNNMDGAGFAVCINNKIAIFKGYTTFDSFMEAYKPHATRAAIIHFRIATHGETTTKNCHPFGLHDDRYAIIHNGIINIDTKFQKEMSDTWHFGELVLTPMLQKMPFNHPVLKYLIETSIGTYNKIVMLRKDGAHVIFNEKQGAWHRGAWYSNDSYKRSKVWNASTTYIANAWETVKEKFPGYEGHRSDWPDEDEDEAEANDFAAANLVLENQLDKEAQAEIEDAEPQAEMDATELEELQAEREWTTSLHRHGMDDAADQFEKGITTARKYTKLKIKDGKIVQ
jgi:predicted glutamine amidotransferase